MKKKLSIVLLLLLLIMTFTGCGNADKQDKIILKYGHTLAPSHSLNLAGEFFAKRMDELTNGRVEVQIFPSGQLGGEKAQLESLMAGGHDFHMGTQAPMSNWTTEFSILDLPYLFYSEQEADTLLAGEVGDSLLELLPDYALYGLGWGENGFRLITNNKNPIVKPQDFGGMLIRTMENKMMLDTFARWNANPTPMSITEVYTALQQGTVDGQENPASLIYAQKFHEVQKYMSISNHFYSPFIFYASEVKMNMLPEDIREAVWQAAAETCEYQRNLAREQNAQSIKDIEASGTEVYYFTDEDKAIWNESSKSIYEDYRSFIGEEIFDLTIEEIAKIRK